MINDCKKMLDHANCKNIIQISQIGQIRSLDALHCYKMQRKATTGYERLRNAKPDIFRILKSRFGDLMISRFCKTDIKLINYNLFFAIQ